jgi:hypothetical protein
MVADTLMDANEPQRRGVKLLGVKTGTTMRLIESLIEHLRRWTARYRVVLDPADDREQRRSTPEIEWNGAMIGDLRRRSLDA